MRLQVMLPLSFKLSFILLQKVRGVVRRDSNRDYRKRDRNWGFFASTILIGPLFVDTGNEERVIKNMAGLAAYGQQ
jgi:hypothetical protein